MQTEPEVDLKETKRHSVIEDWRNPSPGHKNYVIKGDQLYEERAIDVSSLNPPPDLIQRQDPLPKSDNTHGDNRGVMIQIKKPQGGGTVRNIPIKDYQASIAANFGTLRRSAIPQQQFESVASKSAKGARLADSENLIPRVQKSSLKVTQKSGIRETAIEKEAVDLKRGHVVQKISVYEENSREPKRRSLESCRRRQLGVPLVGMHNACGLPVIAPWPTQVNLNPAQASGRIVATLRPLPKIPLAVPTGKSRTHPKRKAPQHPGQSAVFRSPKKFAPKSHRVCGIAGDSIVGFVSVPEITKSVKKHNKSQRRPSFKVNRMNTFPSRHSRDASIDGSSRTTFKSVKNEAKRRSPILGTFGRRSLKRGSAKRRTLYAKDDGDDAAKALSTLCLNPLARGREATNMIW